MQDFIFKAITATMNDDLKRLQSQWSMKCRPRAPCHGACLKSVSMTITMQGFILTVITVAEKCTLFLDST